MDGNPTDSKLAYQIAVCETSVNSRARRGSLISHRWKGESRSSLAAKKRIRKFGPLRIEQLDVAVGDYVTEPNQHSESLFRSIRFTIEQNDVLLRLSLPGAFRFIQLRRADDQWKVIAEY